MFKIPMSRLWKLQLNTKKCGWGLEGVQFHLDLFARHIWLDSVSFPFASIFWLYCQFSFSSGYIVNSVFLLSIQFFRDANWLSECSSNMHVGWYFICYCSVTQSCLTVNDPMECSMPGFPVLHRLLETTQTLVHWVGDTIQSSCPLLSPYIFCENI